MGVGVSGLEALIQKSKSGGWAHHSLALAPLGALLSKIGKPNPTSRPRGLSKRVISRVISTLNGVTRIKISLLIADLLSPLGLQVQ